MADPFSQTERRELDELTRATQDLSETLVAASNAAKERGNVILNNLYWYQHTKVEDAYLRLNAARRKDS